MTIANEIHIRIVQEFLSALDERDLYEPLRHLLLAKGYQAWVVHGVHEHGKDLVGTKPANHNLLVNVKKGDIDQRRWKTDVFPSLDEMMKRPINHTGIDESLPRRPVLVFNGVLLPAVDQKVNEFNEYYRKRGDPELDIWDINKLATEFHDHLLSINLVGPGYLEDIQRVVFSISEQSSNQEYSKSFVDKHLQIDGAKFLAFKLAMLYVLRRAESKNNIYPLFHFAEYSLVKMWQKMYEKKDFSALYNFDELHGIYFDSLEGWCESMNSAFDKKAGLMDWQKNGELEIVCYPLRTFDAVRRIAYMGFYHAVKNNREKADMFATILIKIIVNNRAASTPLAAWNYNDLGLAFTLLYATGHDEEARTWLFNLIDFLLSLHLHGYGPLPQGGDLRQIFNVIFRDKSAPIDRQSSLIPLIFEFAILFGAQEVFVTFRRRLDPRLSLFELGMPPQTHEGEIYSEKVINSVYREVRLPLTWEFAKRNWKQIFRNTEENYTLMVHSRPYVLGLVSNVYRDRSFPELWRNYNRQNNI